jgi:tRNA G46 methylase TrmB
LKGEVKQARLELVKVEEVIQLDVLQIQDKFTKHKLNEQLREIKVLMNAKSISKPNERVFAANAEVARVLGFSSDLKVIEAIIAQDQEKVLEICSGLGEWLIEKAKKEKNKIFFASEIRVDRCFEIMVRMFAEGVENLYILCGDVNKFLGSLPDGIFADIHINFPEPPAWHENDTDSEGDLLTLEFLQRVLSLRKVDSGKLSILSDNKKYMESVARRLEHASIKKVRSDGASYFDRMFGKKHDRFEIVI